MREVNNVAGVGIIYRESDPSQLFIERKDNTLPMVAFRLGLCPLGGNWIGEAAKTDRNTWDIFHREIYEELNPGKEGRASTKEAEQLGLAPDSETYQVLGAKHLPNEEELLNILSLKKAITKEKNPFGDYVINIPKKVLDRADSNNKRDGIISLVSYWVVPLSEEDWGNLVTLQERFRNLSSESTSEVISLEEILKGENLFAYGHDRQFQEFFLSKDLSEAKEMALIEGISSQKMGTPLESFKEYEERYKVKRTPFN
jgi:hypothetical protein